MAVLVWCLAVLAADPQPQPTEPQPRAYHEIQSQISDLLKREAQTRNDSDKAAIVRQMCALHAQIVADSRYPTSDTLQEYRGRLWSRLRRVQTEVKQQLARTAGRTDRQAASEPALPADADPAAVAAADSLAASLALLDQSQGGPGALLAFGGRAGPADYGPDLVDLIERTINPAFWDTNGGPGSVMYYAPLKCLVVRATSDMHGKIGGALGGLRDAAR